MANLLIFVSLVDHSLLSTAILFCRVISHPLFSFRLCGWAPLRATPGQNMHTCRAPPQHKQEHFRCPCLCRLFSVAEDNPEMIFMLSAAGLPSGVADTIELFECPSETLSGNTRTKAWTKSLVLRALRPRRWRFALKSSRKWHHPSALYIFPSVLESSLVSKLAASSSLNEVH